MSKSTRATVLYVRISKDDEHTGDSYSITNQLTVLTRYAEEHGYKNIKVFKDDGYTGTNFDRPGFQKMYSLVKSGQVERIIVKDMSRLGRNYLEAGRYIDVEFPRYNVQFIAINEGFDSNGGELFLSAIFNLINEYYSMDISKKQKAAFRARSMRGDHITSKIPYGYKRNPSNKNLWIIDEEAAKAVRIIFEKYIAGEKILDICEHLKKNKFKSPANHSAAASRDSVNEEALYCWRTSSIIDIVDRQEYCGDTVNFKTYHVNHKTKSVKKHDRKDYVIIENTQEPIITREQYDLAQKRRDANRRTLTERVTHLLDGLVYCEQCKNRLYLNKRTSKKNGDYFVYICNNYKKNNSCTAHYITEDKLVRVVRDTIKQLFQKYHELDKVEFRRYISKIITERTANDVKAVKKEIEDINKRLAEITQLEKELFKDKNSGAMSPERFNRICNGLDEEAEELEEKQGQYALVLNKIEDNKQGIDIFVRKIEIYADLDVDDNLEFIIQNIVYRVYVDEKIKNADESESESIVSGKVFFTAVGILF